MDVLGVGGGERDAGAVEFQADLMQTRRELHLLRGGGRGGDGEQDERDCQAHRHGM